MKIAGFCCSDSWNFDAIGLVLHTKSAACFIAYATKRHVLRGVVDFKPFFFGWGNCLFSLYLKICDSE